MNRGTPPDLANFVDNRADERGLFMFAWQILPLPIPAYDLTMNCINFG